MRPTREQEWIWITPGSILATALWLLVSLGFRFYVTNFGSYNATYGAIGGVIILMLWFYVSGLAVLAGAELNAEIEHASPYGKAPGERVPGEKKMIGPMAERAFEERRAKGMISAAARTNRDEQKLLPPAPPGVVVRSRTRTSDWILSGLVIGEVALMTYFQLSKALSLRHKLRT